MYATNYVYLYKLADYGLEPNDEMSLYHASQITQWSILEGWTPSDVVKQDEVIADETMSALADKIYALYQDIYAYSIDPMQATYEKGIEIQTALNGNVIGNYDIQESDLNRPSYGQSYYRTPLLKALPKQEYGYLFQGDYAFSYTVSLNGAPVGSRVVNKEGVTQNTFTTNPGEELEFYVEIPADKVVGQTGSVTVNVETAQFRRADAILWLPTIETAYTTLVENYFIADSATQSMTVNYTGIGGVAQVIISKLAEQWNGFEKVSSPYGDIYKPVYEKIQLAGSTYEIYIESADGSPAFLATDGELYMDGDKLFPGFLTSVSGQTSFDVLPMSTEYAQTGFMVIELKTTAGYLSITAPAQSLLLTQNPTGLVSGTTEYEADRIQVDFGFTKFEEYFNAEGNKAYRPAEGIVFGVYTVDAVAGIPAGSLVGTLTSDVNGYVDGSVLDLPVNMEFIIREVGTKPNLTLDTQEYHLDTTVPDGYADPSIRFDVTDADANVVTSLTNYLRPGNFTVSRDIEIFDKILGQFAMVNADTPHGQIGIYSNPEATVLVKTLLDSDFSTTSYYSGDLPDGVYYVKDMGYTDQYKADETVYQVTVKAGETSAVSLSNTLKAVSFKLIKLDVTNPLNTKLMANVDFNIVIDGMVVDAVTTDLNGEALIVDLKVGYTYEFIESVPSGYNLPGSNATVNLENADETTIVQDVIVENTKTTISGNIVVNVINGVSKLSVSGIEYSVYSKEDTGFTTPLASITTDAQGQGTFSNLPAAVYVLKETKTMNQFQATPVMEVDLTEVMDGDTVEVNLELEVVKVNIHISNIDEETGNKLDGARFGLYAADNTLIVEFVVGSEGYSIENVHSGEYTLKQTTAPTGYVLNTNVVELDIKTGSPNSVNVSFANRPVVATVRIVVVDALNGARLTGASFDLFSSSDAALANKLGTVATNAKDRKSVV